MYWIHSPNCVCVCACVRACLPACVHTCMCVFWLCVYYDVVCEFWRCVCVRCVPPPESVFPYPEDDGGVQARVVWDQRGLVCLPLLSSEQVCLFVNPCFHSFTLSFHFLLSTNTPDTAIQGFGVPFISYWIRCICARLERKPAQPMDPHSPREELPSTTLSEYLRIH